MNSVDIKKSPSSRKYKRQKIEDAVWDCSVCTYQNTAEAFKCLMCDVRKGTSTRKPRLNSALVAQQAATLPSSSGTHNGITGHHSKSHNHHSSRMSSSSSSSSRKSGHGGHSSKPKQKFYPARLKNVDRSSAQTREVTVNSVTVVITEFKPLPKVNRRESSEQSFSESNDSRC